MRRRDFFVPSITLDKASDVPLHRQIYSQIAQSIRSGAIQNQARLPSTRVMAQLLGVSRNTVLAAYDSLAADDLIRGERGAGMLVNGAARGLNPFAMRNVLRAARYPERVLAFTDPDGNALYIRH